MNFRQWKQQKKTGRSFKHKKHSCQSRIKFCFKLKYLHGFIYSYLPNAEGLDPTKKQDTLYPLYPPYLSFKLSVSLRLSFLKCSPLRSPRLPLNPHALLLLESLRTLDVTKVFFCLYCRCLHVQYTCACYRGVLSNWFQVTDSIWKDCLWWNMRFHQKHMKTHKTTLGKENWVRGSKYILTQLALNPFGADVTENIQ